MANTSQVARQLRDEGWPVKVAVPFAQALAAEERGDNTAAEEYLNKAIAAEEALTE